MSAVGLWWYIQVGRGHISPLEHWKFVISRLR